MTTTYVEYATWKTQQAARYLSMFYIAQLASDGVTIVGYYLYAANTGMTLETVINSLVDIADFDANYKARATSVLSPGDVTAIIAGVPSVVDSRTGAQTIKSVPRTSTHGRVAFAGAQMDAPAGAQTATLIRFPFQIDLVQGFFYSDLAAGSDDDLASFQIAPQTDLAIFAAGQPVLAAPIAIGDKQITLTPQVLTTAVGYALIDSGFFQIEVEEAGVREAVQMLVTDYDEATGVVSLGIFKAWVEGSVEPTWTGFAHAYSHSAQVLVTRVAANNISIAPANATAFGSNGLDSAPVAPDVLFRLPYQNNSASAKRVRIVLQVLTGKPEEP